MGKPQVGISSMWYEGNPCNMHLLSLAEHVKAGVVSACTDWAGPRWGQSWGLHTGAGAREHVTQQHMLVGRLEQARLLQQNSLLLWPGCGLQGLVCCLAQACMSHLC